MKITAIALALVCASFLPTTTESKRLQLPSFAPPVLQRYVHAKTTIAPGHKTRITSRIARNQAAAFTADPASKPAGLQYLTPKSDLKPIDIAKQFAKEHLGWDSSSYEVMDHYTSKHNGVTHIYLKQQIHGLEVTNGDLNINIDREGRIFSFGDSFFREQHKHDEKNMSDAEMEQVGSDTLDHESDEQGQENESGVGGLMFQSSNAFSADVRKPSPKHAEKKSKKLPGPQTSSDRFMDPGQAVLALAKYLQLPTPPKDRIVVTPVKNARTGQDQLRVLGFDFTESNGIPVAQKYIQFFDEESQSSRLRKVWDIQLEMEENWFHAHVDAATGNVLSLSDWVHDASYEVFPIGVNDPLDGSRKVIQNPADKEASPLGWHAESEKVTFTTTRGNNVIAQENVDGTVDNDYEKNWRPEGGADLKFEFPLNLTNEPSTYLNASVTNLFYWNNVMHDVFYKYGFNEESGNFQTNNFGRGGRDGDCVIANAQDGAGFNNANFATPPDGQNGKMRMYVWDRSQPKRDGDLESGIIIHEYAHGISTRLTGGPMNSNCLAWGESGGMGEGWGDFFATVLRQRKNYTREMDFSMGSYAFGNEKGIRKFIYSTNMQTNPSTYKLIKKWEYFGVHAKGEVWAAILNEVYWNLVDGWGYSDDVYNPQATGRKDAEGPAGNIVALQLVIDGMKLQPCRPSFVNARDAILQADEVTYGGVHQCALWKGFAKRGLGVNAKRGGKEDFSVPEECQE